MASSEKQLICEATTDCNRGLIHINIELFKKKADQVEYRLQQRVCLILREIQKQIWKVENSSMDLPNSESTFLERNFEKRIAPCFMGAATIKKQQLLTRGKEKPYNSFQK